ncbi:MAG: CHAT domain-containing protein, partial [Bacteroidetes bacterium]
GNTSDPAALESLLEQIDYIENRFAWQRFQHSRALRMRGSQAAPYRQRLSLHQQIITAQQQGATAQVQALRDALRELEELPASGSEAQSEGGVLQQLRATLAPKQLVLKYQACGSRLYCFGIAADTLWVQHLPVAAHWPQAVERFWADIRRQASVALQGARLGRQLLPQAIDNYQELIIVPGASLANLPFQALSHRGDYLLSTHTISYAPHLIFIGAGSAQPILESKPASLVLAPIGAQARAAAEGLAVRAATDRLRGAAAEGLSVAQNLAATLLDENTATKPRVLAALPQAEWVHVATHAVYDSAAPNLSYLQLAAGDRLYLEEVYGLSMQAKLVLLSACQTATSRPQSNRLQAFHRAFFQAGVPSVVAGLWELPDQATQQVVEQFYAELAQGRSAADALRHAQLACLARTDGAYAHPFFWAGLIVQGDTKVVPATRKTKRWMWLFGLAGVLLLGAAIILWRRAQSRSGRGQALQQIE